MDTVMIDKATKEYLAKKIKELKQKVFKAKKFEKKKDWKEFRTNINNTCSSNGRKAEFDSVNGGSNPSQVAKFKRKIK